MSDDLSDELLALISRHPAEDVDPPGTMGWLQRLCRVATDDLAASGVGITLVSGQGDMVSVATSGSRTARLEALQLELGEGPCVEAFQSRRPVLVPDLNAISVTQWPGYSRAARAEGLRAVFALPLQVGAGRLGALDVYRDEIDALSSVALTRALTYAELAIRALLQAQDSNESELNLEDQNVGSTLYLAQGMVMVQLGVSAADALARLRAHAYAENRTLGDVADDIIARRLTLEPG